MNTTEENNKLIAEFMGFKLTDRVVLPEKYKGEDSHFSIIEFIDNVRESDNLPPCSIENLKFHKDWNWLMEVVEKIETTSYNVPENLRRGFMKNTLTATGIINSYYDDREEFLGWSASSWLGTKTLWDSTMLGEDLERYETKIEATYNACVEFINWYNEQNK